MVLSLLRAPRILVVGLGVASSGDEAIGIHLARSLRGTLDGVDVEEMLPPCPDFLEAFHDYDVIIALDAVQWSEELGRVLVVSPYGLSDWKGTVAPCEQALEDALAASRETGRRVPRIDVVGVCILDQEKKGDRLSPALAAKYEAVLADVRQVVTDLIRHARDSMALPSPKAR